MNCILRYLGTGFVAVYLCGAVPCAISSDRDITLPKPKTTLNVDVMQAFQQRRSIRSFVTGKEITLEDISTILWAGNGVNRPDGKRTAPAPRGRIVNEVYVAMNKGVYRYDAPGSKLTFVSAENIKGSVSMQKFASEASCIIILTGTPDALGAKNRDKDLQFTHCTAGTIAENIYLAVDALGLGTCLMAGLNPEVVTKTLDLKDGEIPLYIMPVGYLK